MCCIIQGMCLKAIICCDYYPLLVLGLPNDFLFHSEPKGVRWDPLHQYWTTNIVLGVYVYMGGVKVGVGWTSTWVGGVGVDINMGGWGWASTWMGGVGWMSGSEGGWLEWGWDAYGPRSRGAV